jgi:hypothetical protein
MPMGALSACLGHLSGKKLIWDVSAFYFLAVDRRIGSTHGGVRRRRFEPDTYARRLAECVTDNPGRRQFCDADLDLHQRNLVQRHRLMERYRGDQRHV